MSITRYGDGMSRGLVAVALVVVSLCGCDDTESRMAKLPSQERMYAESLFVPAGDLGEGWTELGRQVMARSVYGMKDVWHDGRADVLPFFEETGPKLLKPKGPCSVLAGIAYAKATAKEAPVELSAIYLCRRYHALPLKAEDALPMIPVKAWDRGTDGVAMGIGDPTQTAVAGTTAAATGTETAKPEEPKAKEERPADNKSEAEPKTKDAEAVDTPAAKEKNEGDKEPVSEVKASAVSKNEAGTSEEEKAPKAKGAEPKDGDEAGTCAPPAADAEPAKAEAKDASAAEAAAPEAPGHLIYLAANGLLVKVWTAADPEAEEVKTAVAAIRKRLVASVALEERQRQEVMKKRGNREEKIKVEAKWDPNADMYWRLLDFAIGGTILEKKY